MKMKQLIAVLGLLLLVVAFAPPAAEAQYRRGGYGGRGQRGGTIGGPHNTYPIDRSAAPCLEDGSFGPNNQYQTPYNGPYGFPGQHPCQFDWASMNRQKQDVRLGWANLAVGTTDLVVDILSYRRAGKNIKLGEQNLQVNLTNQGMLQELLSRSPQAIQQPVALQQQQSMNVQGSASVVQQQQAGPPWEYRPSYRPAPMKQSRVFFNCQPDPVKMVNNATGEEVDLGPVGSGHDKVTKAWNTNDIQLISTDGRPLGFRFERNLVAIVSN